MAEDQKMSAASKTLTGVIIVGVVLLLVFYKSFFFTVESDQLGVVLRFGEYSRTVGQGLRLRMPPPFENVFIASVTKIRRVEVGYQTVRGGKRHIDKEALMLTGDENIVDIEMVVQYVIKDIKDYFFTNLDPDLTVKVAAEASLRAIVGSNAIDDVLTDKRAAIQSDIQIELQSIIDVYKLGVTIQQIQLQEVHPPKAVIEAFKDVQRAKEDKETKVNSAMAYRNDLVPRSKGAAEQKILEAEGYKAKRVAEARGDAERFIKLHDKYKTAKSITKQRMYYETMMKVLPGKKKYMLSGEGNGTLNLLNLDKIGGSK